MVSMEFSRGDSRSCCQGQMISQDKLEKERIDSKNAVEEYVYDTREKLSGRLEGFIKEKVHLIYSEANQF